MTTVDEYKVVFENVSIGGELFQWDFGDGSFEERSDTTHIIHEYLKTISPNAARRRIKWLFLSTRMKSRILTNP